MNDTSENVVRPAEDVAGAKTQMDPALKARWLEALRSGRYAQGYKSLKCETGFCCLGVALDVIDSGQWNDTGWGWDEDEDRAKFDMSETCDLGFQLGVPGFICDLLANRNDGCQDDSDLDDGEEQRRWSFTEIADWIEANL